jgi:hypothetical protein
VTALPPEVRARVLEAARREPSPCRAETRRTTTIVLVAGFTVLLGLLMVLGGFVGGERPASYLVLSTVGWLAMALIATWGAVGRGRSMVGRPQSWLRMVAILTMPVMTAWVLLAGIGWPESERLGCPAVADLGCLGFTVLLGVGPFCAFLFARRRSDPVRPRWTGAALGAASGAWGAVAMHARCICADSIHLVVAHAVPIAILGGVGWLVGKHVLALSDPA